MSLQMSVKSKHRKEYLQVLPKISLLNSASNEVILPGFQHHVENNT